MLHIGNRGDRSLLWDDRLTEGWDAQWSYVTKKCYTLPVGKEPENYFSIILF